MKVLLVNSPGSVRLRDAAAAQMRRLAESLKLMGVEAVESSAAEPEANGCDLAHVFDMRTPDATHQQVTHLKKARLPVALSPIYANPSLALWGTQVTTTLFRTAKSATELDRWLADLRTHTLKAKLPDGTVMTAESQNRPRPDQDSLQRGILEQVDYLLPNSILEMHDLVRTFRICGNPFTVVPPATEPLVFLDADPRAFVQKHGIRDFVLQVGGIEPVNNQLLLAYALRDLELPLVLIGPVVQRGYLDWCRKYGPKNLKVLPQVAVSELRSAYAAARVHVLPSWMPTGSMATLEAALANCNVVISIAGYEINDCRELAGYCDPADPASIRAAVLQAFKHYERDAPRRLALKQRILQEYTGPQAAELTFRAYRQMLAAK